MSASKYKEVKSMKSNLALPIVTKNKINSVHEFWLGFIIIF